MCYENKLNFDMIMAKSCVYDVGNCVFVGAGTVVVGGGGSVAVLGTDTQ